MLVDFVINCDLADLKIDGLRDRHRNVTQLSLNCRQKKSFQRKFWRCDIFPRSAVDKART